MVSRASYTTCRPTFMFVGLDFLSMIIILEKREHEHEHIILFNRILTTSEKNVRRVAENSMTLDTMEHKNFTKKTIIRHKPELSQLRS